MAYDSTIWPAVSVGDYVKLSQVDAIDTNVQDLHDNVLQLTSDASTVVGSSGTPCNFLRFRGAAASSNIIDVSGNAGSLAMRSGTTTSGASASSLLKLNASGLAGATTAAQLRLADIDDNNFLIEDHNGVDLYEMKSTMFAMTVGTIANEDDSAMFDIRAETASGEGSAITLKGENVTTGWAPGNAGDILLSHRDNTYTGLSIRALPVSTGAAETLATIDDNLIKFYDPAASTTTVTIVPSSKSIEGFTTGTSQWVIDSTGFRFGTTTGDNMAWVQASGTLSMEDGGVGSWTFTHTGLEFRSGGTLYSRYRDNDILIRDSSGNTTWGFDAADKHMNWAATTTASSNNGEAWINPTAGAGTKPQLNYRYSGTTYTIDFV